jgi:phasin family protein
MGTEKNDVFGGFDFSQAGVEKMFESLKVPGVDWHGVMESQSKNIAALVEANRRAVQGMEAITRRQFELVQQAMTDAVMSAKQTVPADPREAVVRQTEAAKLAFEKAVTGIRELADMMQKSNREALDVVNQRISAGLSEIKDRMTRG